MSADALRGLPAKPALDALAPTTRVIAAVAVVAAASSIRDPAILLAGLLASLAAAPWAGIDLRGLLHRLLHVEGFVVVLVAALPFTVPGDPVFTLAGLAATAEGLTSAAVLGLRVNLAVVAIAVLIGGLEPARLGATLERLGLPARLVALFLFALRWVALLGAEASRLRDGLRARAFVARTSPHGFRTLGHAAARLLIRAFERAGRVEEAMRLRGYAGRSAWADEAPPGRVDLVFAIGLGAALLAALAVDRFGWPLSSISAR